MSNILNTGSREVIITFLTSIKPALFGLLLFLALPTLAQKPKISFFTELPAAEFAELFADSLVISELQRLNAEIRMGMLDFAPERAEVVKKLNQNGIPVVAWLLLPKEEGYWFNMENGEDALERYADLKKWTLDNQLQWKGIGIDLEPNIEDIVLMTNNPKGAMKKAYFRLFDSDRVKKGAADYQKLIDQIKADGYPLESYIFPFMFDERQAGTQSFQKISGINDLTVDTEIPMLYTSFFGKAFLPVYGEGLKAVALGSTGGGVEIPGLPGTPTTMTWEDLERDILVASRTAEQVHIFCLESSVEKGFLPKIKTIDYNKSTPNISAEISQLNQTRAKIQRILKVLDYPVLVTTVVALLFTGLILFLVWLVRLAVRKMKIN